jgi:hypothetical protein
MSPQQQFTRYVTGVVIALLWLTVLFAFLRKVLPISDDFLLYRQRPDDIALFAGRTTRLVIALGIGSMVWFSKGAAGWARKSALAAIILGGFVLAADAVHVWISYLINTP